jgi:hypothetical protein
MGGGEGGGGREAQSQRALHFYFKSIRRIDFSFNDLMNAPTAAPICCFYSSSVSSST